MNMTFDNLDETTREYMIRELESDLAADNLYLSPRLTDEGSEVYPTLLREAFLEGNEETLATEIRDRILMKDTEERNTARGVVVARIPEAAPDTLAEGEFNRFYCRALCLRAIDENIDELIVYRAKAVEKPRSDSEQLVGTTVDPSDILDSARAQPGTGELGIPHGPNSGLSVKFT